MANKKPAAKSSAPSSRGEAKSATKPAERNTRAVTEKQRKIQREIDDAEGSKQVKPAASKLDGAGQNGNRPKPPMPAQHQLKPGLESQLDPRPQFLAPDYRGSDKLRDRVALITGGDSGIGRAVAVLYAREGADVAIVYLDDEESDAQETREYVEREGRRCLLLPGDVKDPDFCREAAELTVSKFGRLDILVTRARHSNCIPAISRT